MRAIGLSLILTGTVIGGCQTGGAGPETGRRPDFWATYYHETPKPLEYAPTEQVEVRQITRDQLMTFIQERKQYLDEHKLAPEDISSADARALRAMALEAFRIREDPDRVSGLGYSNFWCLEERGGPNDQEMLRLARRIGSDMVVYMSEHVGTIEGTAVVPVPSFSQGNAFATATNNRGGFGTATATGSSFGVQGQVVPRTYDKWETWATFYRHVTPEERRQIDAKLKPAAAD